MNTYGELMYCFWTHFCVQFQFLKTLKRITLGADQLSVLLFLVLHEFLYQQISFFYNFLELHSTLSEKDCRRKFSLFNRFAPLPSPFNGPKSAKRGKSFSNIFPKMPPEKFLFQKFVDKILPKHLLRINSELLQYIYL